MTGQARYLKADRGQLRWDLVDLESQLPSDHRARVVMAFVDGLELGALYERIGARAGQPGRPPPDPKILLALWLFATLEGVGSARHLDRLCERDTAYRWLCGGVPMNYHSLSDFRSAHGDVLDRLLSDSVTALLAEGIVTLEEIAVDGTKIQASAGRGSFRRGERLAALHAAAQARVAQLKADIAQDPAAGERRLRAARLRATEEGVRRAQKARDVLETLHEERRKRAKTHKAAEAAKDEPRVSLSDPEARRMRFADGAVRAGYNAQLAVLPGVGIVAGVDVSDRRNDAGLACPMVEQIKRRYRVTPRRFLVDTRYATRRDIMALAKPDESGVGMEVYSPVPPDKADAKPESQRKRASRRRREAPEIVAWRARMAEPASKAIYRRRGWCETINGLLKERTLRRMVVRSIAKVRCVVLLNALAHNLWRAHQIRLSRA